MSFIAEPAAFSPRRALTSVVTLGGIGITLSGTYAITGFGIPCPWRYLTHTLCPFCGSTTMGAALLHFDFGAAWAANQFVFLLLAGTVLASAFWVVEILGGPALRLPPKVADQRLWYLVIGTAAVLFAIARNLG